MKQLMKKISLLLFFIIYSNFGFAQKALLFSNATMKKEIMIKEGDLIKLSYNGYIGQKEIKSGIVYSIQDSLVEIISNTSSGKMNFSGPEVRFIYIKDITGFRKFHLSRPYLMALSNISITIGSILLYYTIDKRTNMNFGEKLGLSLGTGLLSTIIVKGLFPERIKYKIGKDWQVRVLQ